MYFSTAIGIGTPALGLIVLVYNSVASKDPHKLFTVKEWLRNKNAYSFVTGGHGSIISGGHNNVSLGNSALVPTNPSWTTPKNDNMTFKAQSSQGTSKISGVY